MIITADRKLISKENSCIDIHVLMSIGDRDQQQDCIGLDVTESAGLVCVCDGMGGHRGGQLASNYAVDHIMERFDELQETDDVQQFLSKLAGDIDLEISEFKDEEGNLLRAGSTMVSVFIRDKELYWISVGDSRLYIARNTDCIQATEDHIYGLALQENRNAGLISEEFFQNESGKAEALISFLGVGELPLIDSNSEPFRLQSNDKLLLMSDGIYKFIGKEKILGLLSENTSIDDALVSIENEIEGYSKINNIERDNMTLAIINIK